MSGLVRIDGGGSLSGASTQFVNVFSATYNAYKVTMSNVTMSAGGPIHIQLGVGGTPSTTNYQMLRISNNGTTVGGFDETLWRILGGSSGVAGNATEIFLYNPALAVATKMYSSFYDAGGARHVIANGNHSTATAYTDLKFIDLSGTMTGLVNIYGYALS